MKHTDRSRFPYVFAAAAAVLILAGSLAARLVGTSISTVEAPAAPHALVPSPESVAVEDLEVPCWSCPKSSKKWPVRFRTDLDLLAPLGDGPANAATYFKDFAKPDGPRYGQIKAAREVTFDGPEWLGKVLPPDHPLVEEAQPWCDQATMRFYPDVFELEGYKTRIPNLLHMLLIAKSWVARGLTTEDPEIALADFRRAIRLGRLMRQEDGIVITDLVGLVCIRVGAEGIYRFAVRRGDLELALVASVVLGEVAPQRLLTAEKIQAANLASVDATIDSDGNVDLALSDSDLERAITVAIDSLDRRFQGEAIVMLHLVRHFGEPEQQRKVIEVLNQLAVSADPMIAEVSRWSRDSPVDEQELLEAFELKK